MTTAAVSAIRSQRVMSVDVFVHFPLIRDSFLAFRPAPEIKSV